MRPVVRRIVSHLRAPFLAGTLCAVASYSASCGNTRGRPPGAAHADAGRTIDDAPDAAVFDSGDATPKNNDAGHVLGSIDAGHDLDARVDAEHATDSAEDDDAATPLVGVELVGDYANARGGEGEGSCAFSIRTSGQFTMVYPLISGGRLDIASATSDPEQPSSSRHAYYEDVVDGHSYAVRVDRVSEDFVQAIVYEDGYQSLSCRTGTDLSLSRWLQLASHAGHYSCTTDGTINFRSAGTRWPAELVVDAAGTISYLDSTGNSTTFSHQSGDPIIVTMGQVGSYFAVGYATILQIDVEFEAAYVLISRHGSESQEYCTDLVVD